MLPVRRIQKNSMAMIDLSLVREGEGLDRMGFSDLCLIQDPRQFCYGIDAVLLAVFTAQHSRRMGKMMEMGCGNGAVSLIVSHKLPKRQITAVECQAGAADLARRNVQLNGLDNRISVWETDILDLDAGSEFDVIFSNPPYVSRKESMMNANHSMRIARHETSATLQDFLQQGKHCLKSRGELFLVHRINRLAELIELACAEKLEPKLLQTVSPGPGREPNLVLIKLVRDGGRDLRVLPELHVRDARGAYTGEIKKSMKKIEFQLVLGDNE